MTAFTFDQLAALATLRRAWPTRRLVLIGAAALGCQIEIQWRRTNDLDLTLVADPDEASAELRTLGWRQDPCMEQRWHGPEGVLVDVLAVGEDSLAAGKLVFSASDRVMNLAGFDLALSHVTQVQLEPGLLLDVATVPVIAVLKMAAWFDRPHERERDLEDLARILDEYLAADSPRRWEDDMIQSGLEFDDQAAFALGKDIGRMAEAVHRGLVERFLEAVEDDDSQWHAQLARFFRGTDDPSARLHARLRAFRLGLLPHA
jgi:predicted nucleotidyltransferase